AGGPGYRRGDYRRAQGRCLLGAGRAGRGHCRPHAAAGALRGADAQGRAMTRRRVLSEDERELWRHATREVTPLNNMTPPPAAPTRRRTRRPSATVSAQAMPSSAVPPATAPFNRAW